MVLTEVPIAFCEGFQTDLADTVHMPEGMDIINLFLTSVRADRAVKQSICAWIGQIQKGDQVVLQ